MRELESTSQGISMDQILHSLYKTVNPRISRHILSILLAGVIISLATDTSLGGAHPSKL
jgi:hypothetical protein